MLLDWWFELSGKICRIEMDIGSFGMVEITVDDSLDAQFVEQKVFRTGTSRLYKTDDGHTLSVNDVKFRGERYVSLYIDRKLVKEYQVRAEKYKAVYMSDPELYDSRKIFFLRTIPIAVAIGVFIAMATVILLTLAGIIDSLKGVGLYFAVLLPLLTLVTFCFKQAVYSAECKRMEKYAIISSVNPNERKRKRKRKKKRPFMSIR